MLTSIIERFTARRVPDGLLLFRDRATGGHGHARLQKFGQRVPDFAKLPGFLLSGGRATGHGHCPVHPYFELIGSCDHCDKTNIFPLKLVKGKQILGHEVQTGQKIDIILGESSITFYSALQGY